MVLNEISKERIAEKVLAEMNKARLFNKDVAEKFEADGATMSHLKRRENHNKISARVWNNMRKWYYSGVPLEAFRIIPEEDPEPTSAVHVASTDASPACPEPTKEEAAAYKKEARTATRSLREEHEKKAEAKKQRKLFEASQPDEKKIRLPRPGKGDINPVTGTKITLEIFADYFTITVPK